MTELMREYGSQHMTATLRRVLVRPPGPLDLPSWRDLGWRGEPDAPRLGAEHEAFCSLLADAGAEIVVSDGTPGNLDAIYTFDPALVTDQGALLLRPGKSQRRDEPAGLVPALDGAGVPISGRLSGSEHAEGGDTLWLDSNTLLVGRSYRTNDAGIEALRRTLPQVEVLAFDLPHLRGPGEVLHLLSLISPLADDLAVAYLPLLPTRLVELLHDRDVSVVEVPDQEFETMAANVLALAPRVALALDGNGDTRRRMERAGVEVLVYDGRELSKGDGGPTCLTRPLLRGRS
jgi:N-dimethylarginine dimethylaminohydrolase